MSRAAAIVLAVLVLSPLAAAAWSTQGSTEPSTTWDREAGAMFHAPDTDGGGPLRVYFDVVPSARWAANPNVGALGSRVYPAEVHEPFAYLGAWKDCNRDGAVGIAEAALLEYPAAMLTDASVCPAGSRFHHGGIVSEMVWIGPKENRLSYPDPRYEARFYIPDSGVLVWGDRGAPGDALRAGCPLNPMPAGTTARAGRVLGHADCHVGHSVARSANALAEGIGADAPYADPERPGDGDGPANMRFPVHPYHDESAPEGERDGLYDPQAGSRPFTVWDCSQRSSVDVRDPLAAPGRRGPLSSVVVPVPATPLTTPLTLRVDLTDADGSYYDAPAFAPAVGAPPGSAWHAVNETYYGALYNCAEGANSVLVRWDIWGDNLVLERPAALPSVARRQNDVVFEFNHDDGWATVLTAAAENRGVRPREALGVPHMSYSAGVGVGRGLQGALGEEHVGWFGKMTERVDEGATRDDVGQEPRRTMTYYASLGDASLALVALPGAARTYGLEWCAAATGVARGFDCDATHWWDPAHGAPERPDSGWSDALLGAFPGDSYHLRDVDCYDDHVTAGVYASATTFDGASCG